MSSEIFYHEMAGKTARQAFNKAVKAAGYDHGHSGYSGTIVEKDDFVMMGSAATPAGAAAMADGFIERCDERIDDKWGPAGCIEIGTHVKGQDNLYLFFGWASA